MFDNRFSLADIHIEVINTADRYMKTVLINTKNRYFRVLRKLERNGITVFELERYETNLTYEENGFKEIDSECFMVGNEPILIEKSELTDALLCLTPLQLQILLKNVLLEKSHDELAAEYGVTKRMIRKHKHIALEKLKRRLTDEK